MEGIIKGIIKLNPLTEIILLISVSIIGFTNESIKMDILILVMIAMISSCTGLTRTSIKALSIFAILQGIKYFIFPILPDRISAHFGLLVVHVPKLIPIFLVGQIIIKTNSKDLKFFVRTKENYFGGATENDFDNLENFYFFLKEKIEK